LKSRVIARRYATAFFRAIELTDLETELRDFRAFFGLLKEIANLKFFLGSPTADIDRKILVAKTCFSDRKNSITGEFMSVLLRRHRFDHLTEIGEEVERLYRKKMNILGVLVKSAVPLLPAEEEQIRSRLTKQYPGGISLQLQIDPSIKGGLIVFMEDRVLDSSVRRRLNQLLEALSRLDQEWLEDMRTTGEAS